MKENQHNDNLERFFKANLENYSPSPSADFWSRMEPAIPPKPAGFFSKSAKWLVLGLLALATILVLWFWQRDRSQLDRLKKTVAQQQRQIQAMNEEAAGQHEIPTKSEAFNGKNGAVLAEEKVAFTPKAPMPTAAASQNKSAKVPGSILAKQPKNPAQQERLAGSSPANQADTQVAGNQIVGTVAGENGNAPTDIPAPSNTAADATAPLAEASRPPQFLSPSSIGPKTSLIAYQYGKAVFVKPSVIVHQKEYPRYAVEAVGKVFRMPLGVLFQQDTFLTGRTNASYGMGFNISYEVNSAWTLQAGYQFTNLRARRLALRYNSFPVAVQKSWAWGRRKHLELKLGASINSLVSARTDSDGQSVKGLKPTWFGLHSALATSWALTDNLDFFAGPTAGFSLSPMTTGRRSWEIGVGAGLRYHL